MTTKIRPSGPASRSASIIVKAAGDRPDPFMPTPDELAKINHYTLRDHTVEELWVVTIRACDNQPDRHKERLLIPALQQLANSFSGRPGLHDHRWSSAVQSARIFDAYVETDKDEASVIKNEPYTNLVIKAYMIRTPENESLRKEVEGGIKKETSIGFFLDWLAITCNICGDLIWDWEGKCSHIPGRTYNGEECIAEIPAHDKLEAIENSWVGVPAQPKAGAVRTQKDAEGEEELRRQLIARKESTVTSKELLALLSDPTKLKETLASEDPAVVAEILGKLKGADAPANPEAAPAPTGAAKGGDPEISSVAETSVVDGVVKKLLDAAPWAEALKATDDTIAAQAKAINELKDLVSSKLAPVGDGPLVTGFDSQGSKNAQGSGVQIASQPGSIGAGLVSSLLG
jgi:hypothetical protein